MKDKGGEPQKLSCNLGSAEKLCFYLKKKKKQQWSGVEGTLFIISFWKSKVTEKETCD